MAAAIFYWSIVLKLRFGLVDGYTWTLEETGKYFGVTRERIRQIETKAIRRLRYSKAKFKDILPLTTITD